MITLLAPLLGLLLGRALGGRVERLAEAPYRWLGLGAVALAVQLALFSTPLGDALGGLAPLAYVASTAVVLVVVLRNLGLPRIGVPGLALVALGAAANLGAIAANGGWMPLDPAAAAAIGESAAAVGYSNSRVLDDPLLAPLIDRIAIAAPGPLAAVVSVGDLLIAAGLLVAIVRGMRGTDARREG